MQSKSEEPLVELKANDDLEERTSAMNLYELYSRCSIAETVRDRRDRYDKADDETRKKIEKDVNIEVEGFSIWLEETKNLNPLNAHGFAVSLKSLLVGLPIGLSMAKLFDAILSDAGSTIE
jgi:abortive infection bacteriophage resistance protein